MQVVDFADRHIKQAVCIAVKNYNEQRRVTPALPVIDSVPDLSVYLENNLGVAALDDDEVLGFLCVRGPFSNAFRSTQAVGVFSPMGANGAAGDDKSEIYALMYRAAAEKWAKSGATSHAICLYTYDEKTLMQFFRYGFGLRCVDAVREMEAVKCNSMKGYKYKELQKEEFGGIFAAAKMLNEHLAMSPAFLYYPQVTDSVILERIMNEESRYFAAYKENELIAYIKISGEGENFACDAPDMLNICGAFCLPEYRGKGIVQNLLNFMTKELSGDGINRLGVDFESYNPAGYGFWMKNFDAYTHSVVRRIDEFAVNYMAAVE